MKGIGFHRFRGEGIPMGPQAQVAQYLLQVLLVGELQQIDTNRPGDSPHLSKDGRGIRRVVDDPDLDDGIKQADDLTDAAFLAHLARLDILPTGYIYPKEERPVRDLLRRRTLLVRQRTAIKLSLQNMFMRQAALNLNWRAIRRLSVKERSDALGDKDYLLFVSKEQLELIEQLNAHITQFEKKVLERTELKTEYE